VFFKRDELEQQAGSLIDFEPCMSTFKSNRLQNPCLQYVADSGVEICRKDTLGCYMGLKCLDLSRNVFTNLISRSGNRARAAQLLLCDDIS
jgi:hypothetical protein